MPGPKKKKSGPVAGPSGGHRKVAYDMPASQESEASEASQVSQASTTTSQSSKTRRAKGSGTGVFYSPVPMVSMTEASSQVFGFLGKTVKYRYPRLATEASTWILGPMPPYDFLKEFLSYGSDDIPSTGQPPAAQAFNAVPARAKHESEIYETLSKALKTADRCPGFSFHITANHADETGPGGKLGSAKPDICCYANQHIDASNVPLSKDGSNRVSHMGFVAFYFEIKAKPSQDFFADPKQGIPIAQRNVHQFVRHGSTAAEDFGQAVNYAVETCKRQHRECCYSISMSGSSTRFIRWDRAGAIVSEAFDIRVKPELLCHFLWCFAHVSDAARGYDLTVEPASPAEETLFHDAIVKHVATQLPPSSTPEARDAEVNKHYEPKAVTAIFLPQAPGFDTNLRHVLVSRPLAAPLSVVGRCTRTYWAYDTLLKRVVLLKDTWRSEPYEAVVAGGTDGSSNDRIREGDILLHLRQKNVRNIPTVEYQEDVPTATVAENTTSSAVGDEDQSSSASDSETDGVTIAYDNRDRQITKTQRFLNRAWVCNRSSRELYVNERKHYRMLSDIAGSSLVELRGTAELLSAAYDAFQALRDAFELANYLHRDVTPGNIVLFADPRSAESPAEGAIRRGYLIDWDIAADVYPTRPRRDVPVSATWQFLSAALCVNLRPDETRAIPQRYKVPRTHHVQDDMESIIYVVLYCALLWTPHNLTGDRLAHALALFDAYDRLDNLPTGGHIKSVNLQDRRVTGPMFTAWSVHATGIWVETMFDLAHPLRTSTDPKYFKKWNPEDVELWLCEFLSTHRAALPMNDRVNIVARHPELFSDKAPMGNKGKPNQATHASPTGSTRKGKSPAKRPADPASGRDPKRSRGYDSDSTLRAHSTRGGRISPDDDEGEEAEWSYSPQLYDDASMASGPSTSTATTSRQGVDGWRPGTVW